MNYYEYETESNNIDEILSEKKKQKFPQRFGLYLRQCRKCNTLYRTFAKMSKVCLKCNKHTYSFKIRHYPLSINRRTKK